MLFPLSFLIRFCVYSLFPYFSFLQDVSPLSCKLAGEVLRNCTAKIESELPELWRSEGITFDDCVDIIAKVCRDVAGRENLVCLQCFSS